MRKVTIVSLFVSVWVSLIGSNKVDNLPLPKANQLNWQEYEMGAIFHYDLHVFDSTRYSQPINRINPIIDYNIFNPNKLDTDQWVKTAKDAGCKFAILTATHETGFGLWQSDVNPFCMKAIKWQDGKGDIIRDFVNSCRKYGIAPGIYIGIRWNSLLGIHNFKAEGESPFADNRQLWYRSLCEKMVEEICTRYGDLFMIWFDGGADDPRELGPDVEPIINKYQPDCLFYHNVDRADLRWGGSESGMVAYPCWATFPTPFSHSNRTDTIKGYNEILRHGDKDGKYWVPPMADVPLRSANGRHEWFWEPGDEESILPLKSLINIYENSIGRNATLVIGLTPDPEGLIPEKDAATMEAFGKAIKERFSTPEASTSGKGTTISLDIDSNKPVNYCIIQEEIKNGERIRRYRVEAKINNRWETICRGESIGHKRIEKFEPVNATAMRIIVEQCVALPDIKNFSVFSVSDSDLLQ